MGIPQGTHHPAQGGHDLVLLRSFEQTSKLVDQNAHSYSSPLSRSYSNLLKLPAFTLCLLYNCSLFVHDQFITPPKQQFKYISCVIMALNRENCLALTALAFEKDEGSLYCFPRPRKTETNPVPSASFPISDLPSELRNEIYTHYFASLPPLSIIPDDVTSAVHNHIALALSSPYCESDILPSIFYSNTTFSFSNRKILRNFAKGEGRDRIARVRIEYGTLSRCHRTDWVFLLFPNFEQLREVTFAFDAGVKEWDGSCFRQWLACVRDAMREAANSRVVKRGRGENAGVMLKVECGEWNFSERVGGC